MIAASDAAFPGKSISLHVTDGAATGAYAIAAAVALLSDGERPEPGIYMPDQLLGLDSIETRFRRLSDMPFKYRLEGSIA